MRNESRNPKRQKPYGAKTLSAIRVNTDLIVRRYIELKPAGTYLKANCPFHDERTPSFFVHTSKHAIRCYGCGFSGDIFTFVMAIEKVGFSDAVEIAAAHVGAGAFNGHGVDQLEEVRRDRSVAAGLRRWRETETTRLGEELRRRDRLVRMVHDAVNTGDLNEEGSWDSFGFAYYHYSELAHRWDILRNVREYPDTLALWRER